MLLNVCDAAEPLMFCPALALLKVTLLEPGVNVPPLLVQSPGRLIAVIVFAENVPAVRVMAPFRFSVARLPPPVTDPPLVLLKVRLLNVWVAAVPLRLRAPEL